MRGGAIASVVALALAAAGCSPQAAKAPAVDPDAWQTAIPTVDLKRAAALYARPRSLPGEAEPVSCAVCHGAEGQGNYGREDPRHVAPHLAGLNAVYVGEQLRAYASGARVFPLMKAMAAPLSAQDVADLAVYVQGLKGGGPGAPAVAQAVLARGREVYMNGLPGKQAPCAQCHGPDGAGRSGRSPEIAGEPLPYLVAQLHTMRSEGRHGTLAADAMTEVAHKLSEADIAAVAAYVASIEPVSSRGQATPRPSPSAGSAPS